MCTCVLFCLLLLCVWEYVRNYVCLKFLHALLGRRRRLCTSDSEMEQTSGHFGAKTNMASSSSASGHVHLLTKHSLSMLGHPSLTVPRVLEWMNNCVCVCRLCACMIVCESEYVFVYKCECVGGEYVSVQVWVCVRVSVQSSECHFIHCVCLCVMRCGMMGWWGRSGSECSCVSLWNLVMSQYFHSYTIN